MPSVTLTADNLAGATYNWSTGSTSATATVTAIGTYTVTVTSARGCTKTATATVTTVGINDVEQTVQTIRLNPNPNNGLTVLEVSASSSSEVAIRVVDVTGRELVMMNKELITGVNQIGINTSDFANGLYFVSVNNKVVRMVVNK